MCDCSKNERSPRSSVVANATKILADSSSGYFSTSFPSSDAPEMYQPEENKCYILPTLGNYETPFQVEGAWKTILIMYNPASAG